MSANELSNPDRHDLSHGLSPAPLSDPLYYLRNAQTVMHWCLAHHADLLLPEERAQLKRILTLDTPTQGLLQRLLLRKGELFRGDALNYSEIPDLSASLGQLQREGLIDSDPALALLELCALYRRDELQLLANRLGCTLPRSANKQQLIDWLSSDSDRSQQRQPLSGWWPTAPFSALRLCCRELFERLRLMFFGNLQQEMSAFVLTELGYQRYEPVALSSASRAFQLRTEVDHYLQLHAIARQLEEPTDPLSDLAAQLPPRIDTAWLGHRYDKTRFALGQAAERSGAIELARQLYADSHHPEARLRQLRLAELHEAPATTHAQALQLLDEPSLAPEYRIRVQRIAQRCARALGQPVPPTPRQTIPTERLQLPQRSGERVEAAVIRYLQSRGWSAFHVESQWLNGLFALLCWEALFTPVTGAFFHPFQGAPADLYRDSFQLLRQPQLARAFARLRDGSYRDTIIQQAALKRGTACDLIRWDLLTPELIEAALALIPAQQLEALLRHLLGDLRHHRRGLPDLICFEPQQQRYRLIEVKGPGDRLQDHQRLWLAFCLAQGIDAGVCQVEWMEGTA